MLPGFFAWTVFLPTKDAHMDPHNTNAEAKRRLLSHAKTLRLHTGNLVNRARLKKKCPCSPSEEVNFLFLFPSIDQPTDRVNERVSEQGSRPSS